ncbi:MAG: c-type cytochrome [Lautropia sp.]|nr:c-type cytochrome [Lautropia sp.]
MANNSNDMGPGGARTEPKSFFKSPTQMVTVVTTALVLPVVLISVMVAYMDTGRRVDELSEEAIEARIRPVAGFELREVKKGGAPRAGEVVYKEVCAACHGSGVGGAPVTGDEGLWAPRIAQGFDTLLQSALKGKNGMPAQGGGDYSDQEIANAVVYLANEGGASFEAPKQEPAAEEGGD